MVSFYSFCLSLDNHGLLFVLTSISRVGMLAMILSLLALPVLALERILPGRRAEALRELLCTAPGTLPLELWELRKGMCPTRAETQLFTSFNLSSTVLLDDVFMCTEKVYTLNLFLYRVCGSLSLA